MNMIKQTSIFGSLVVLSVVIMIGCGKRVESPQKASVKEAENKVLSEQQEKGYDLPIEESEKQEAQSECIEVMELISEIYAKADKGKASNVVIGEKTLLEMRAKVKQTGQPVITSVTYSGMGNYGKMESFLSDCQEGKSGTITIYKIHSDGGLGREKYIFNGKDLFVLSASAGWDGKGGSVLFYLSYTRIKEWSYTKKGWFCYQLCVPEPPEVTEMVDGSRMIRVRPMKKRHRELSKKCVLGLGYQGNNLLCSNWDADHMKKLDFNGMYDCLYEMKYGKKFEVKVYGDGIPRSEFESLIMEYLPVTSEELRRYAVYDEKKGEYAWERLGCSNYDLTYFGISIPEVTKIRENNDGTTTLTVEAVCEMVVGEEAAVTHELTVRFYEDGDFQYLSNKILGNGKKDIPDYHYRVEKKIREVE